MHHLRRHRAGRRAASLVVITATALAMAACGPDASPGAGGTTVSRGSSTTTSHVPSPTTTTPGATPTGTPTTTPVTPTPTPTPTPTRTKPPEPAPVVVLRPGDVGPKVRAMQARLRQIGWFSGDVVDRYGPRTTEAIRGFQAKRGFPVTGVADQRTYDRLLSMTRQPTRDELANVRPVAPEGAWDVDKRCLTGQVICISKSTRRLTWVVDGEARYGMDVRFGSEQLPTREGVFSIYKKKVDVISNLYNTPMPYSMFFSGGQAIHYSSNFARLGYNGSSHGCVNVRAWDKIVRLYDDAPIGTKVVIHW